MILEVQEAALIRRLLDSGIFCLALGHLPSITVASNGDADAEAHARASRLLGLGRWRDLATLLAIKVAANLSVKREHCTVEDLLIKFVNAQLNELPKLKDALGLLWSTSARPVRLIVQLLQLVEPISLTPQVLRARLVSIDRRLRHVEHCAACMLLWFFATLKIEQLEVLVE